MGICRDAGSVEGLDSVLKGGFSAFIFVSEVRICTDLFKTMCTSRPHLGWVARVDGLKFGDMGCALSTATSWVLTCVG